MTREEVIAYGEDYYKDLISARCEIDKKHKEFVKMSVEALKQEPCEDCIRRSDIGLTNFEILMCNGDYKEGLKMLLDKIEKAPSVTPQPKTGHWIIIDDCESFIAKCSECGEIVDSRMISKYPYCHCGAKMGESKE